MRGFVRKLVWPELFGTKKNGCQFFLQYVQKLKTLFKIHLQVPNLVILMPLLTWHFFNIGMVNALRINEHRFTRNMT
jgi:hypothetical protein